ncbi:ESX secretion system protein YueB [Peribacillus sp. Bi96]|uniref:YhgE/Pip domain-containing protein n=1 Tax=unclassified Peribacillus TaxID=2675266 RepID=UPI001D70EBD8|nr:YhgE/Pip domain-containing protein [Peribacillus sp. Bi96]CAH0232832.1 ESX secretion system protein YueB [Peribacillus sp. Bi96]
MLKQEWKLFLTNRKLLGVAIVLLFVPIIYGGLFLSSAWNPYGNTGKLPVAVVNNDVKAEYEGKTLTIGNELVEQLKDNDDLEWHFVTEKEAKKGFDDGTYYMVVTIPEDFSKNASTVMDNKPRKMNLTYDVNPGRSFVSETVGKQATNNLKTEIAESVTKEYAEAIFSQLDEIGEGFGDAADGASKLDDGAEKLQDGNKEVTDNLNKLASSTLTFKDGANKLQIGVGKFLDGVNKLERGATELNKGISQYTSGVGQLQTGVNELASGTGELTNNSEALVQGSSQLSTGLAQVVPGAQNLNTGLTEAQTGSANLNDGLNTLSESANQLTDQSTGIPKLAAGQQSLNEGITKLSEGSQALNVGLKKMDGQLPTDEQLSQLTQGLTSIQSGVNQLQKAVPAGSSTSGTVSSITKDLENSQRALTELQSTIENNGQSTIQSVQNTEAYKSMTSEQQTELIGAIQNELQIQAGAQKQIASSLAANISDLSTQLTDKVMPVLNGLGQLPEQVTNLNNAVNKVNPNTVSALNGYAALRSALEDQLIPGATQLNTGLNEAVIGSNQLTTATQSLNERTPELVNGINQLAQGGSSLNNGLSKLTEGSGQLVDGVSQLQVGSASLGTGLEKYTLGVGQVGEGANKLADGANQLNANSASLNNGSSALVKGTEQLASNLPTLSNGVIQLTDGAGKINEGSSALAEGSSKLGDGISTLQDGTGELSEKLSDGAEEISKNKTTNDNYSMIAEPTKVKEQKSSKVPNYGHALAPYVLSLGLFVGAIAFNMGFPTGMPSTRPTSGVAWWFSKFTVLFIQATLSALVLDAIMIWGMDLQVENMGQFIGVSILTSLTFMFIVTFLTVAFGNPGRLLAMIFLVLQLGASGGMFPVELTNNFFSAVHPFIPMTYSVMGFRQAMSTSLGADALTTSILFLTGCIIVFNLFLLLTMVIRKRKEQNIEMDA